MSIGSKIFFHHIWIVFLFLSNANVLVWGARPYRASQQVALLATPWGMSAKNHAEQPRSSGSIFQLVIKWNVVVVSILTPLNCITILEGVYSIGYGSLGTLRSGNRLSSISWSSVPKVRCHSSVFHSRQSKHSPVAGEPSTFESTRVPEKKTSVELYLGFIVSTQAMDLSIVIPFPIEWGNSPLANNTSPFDSAVIWTTPSGVAIDIMSRIILVADGWAETWQTRQRLSAGFPATSYVFCSFLYLFSSHFAISVRKYPGSIMENAIKRFQIFINERIREANGASENIRVDIYSKMTTTTAILIQKFPIICKMLRNFSISI